MKNQLTKAQAWRAIAKKLLNSRKVDEGLCAEVADQGDGTISKAMASKLYGDLVQYRIAHATLYDTIWIGEFIWPQGTHHKERAMIALWMALEAEEEAR